MSATINGVALPFLQSTTPIGMPYGTPPPGYGYPAYPATNSQALPGVSATGTADVCHVYHLALAAALAGGAGIRALAPLFLLSLFHLQSPEEYPLSHGVHWLGHHGVCIALGILLLVEVLADQVPALDHALHAILTPGHPIAGALAAVAPNYCGGWAVKAPMAIVGFSTALSVHGGKAMLRHAASGMSCGFLNPVVSIVESVLSVLLLLLCFATPVAAVLVAILFMAGGIGACCGAKRLLGGAEEEPGEEEEEESSEDEEARQVRREARREKKRLRKDLKQQQAASGLFTGQRPAEAPAE